MKKVYEALSVILHPVFVPAYGAYVYLKGLPFELSNLQKYMVMTLVLGGTFLVPLLTLLLFRVFGHIKSLRASSIEERKTPIILMIVNYSFLGFALTKMGNLKELAVLAYSCAIGLLFILILFKKQIKTSLHLFGITGLIGLAIIFGMHYYYALPVFIVLILASGILATARLELKAHDMKEIVIGSCLGIGLPVLLNLFI